MMHPSHGKPIDRNSTGERTGNRCKLVGLLISGGRFYSTGLFSKCLVDFFYYCYFFYFRVR